MTKKLFKVLAVSCLSGLLFVSVLYAAQMNTSMEELDARLDKKDKIVAQSFEKGDYSRAIAEARSAIKLIKANLGLDEWRKAHNKSTLERYEAGILMVDGTQKFQAAKKAHAAKEKVLAAQRAEKAERAKLAAEKTKKAEDAKIAKQQALAKKSEDARIAKENALAAKEAVKRAKQEAAAQKTEEIQARGTLKKAKEFEQQFSHERCRLAEKTLREEEAAQKLLQRQQAREEVRANREAARINKENARRLPVSRIIAHPLKGVSPLAVKFYGKKSYSKSDEIISYFWDFGDGLSSTEVNPEHTFIWYMPRDFIVSLTVTDSKGNSATAVTEIKIIIR
jgi:hypothetical protein